MPGSKPEESTRRALVVVVMALALLSRPAPAQEDDLDSLLSGEPGQERTAPPRRAEPEGEASGKRVEAGASATGERPAPPEPERPSASGAPPSGEAESPPAVASSPRTAPRSRRVVEEIIVTAQKIEQSIQDVPISMSVIDDAFLEQQSVTDFRDISLYVPNVSISNNLQVGDVRIRGIGSTFGQTAFEQPVGLVLDGIPYGRLDYFRGPLFDLQRVEVLRGPQGTLFGKNTTAGILSVVTKQPTDEYTGNLGVELGELGRRRFEGGVGGPILADVLTFRLAGLAEERDGFMRNTTARVDPLANPRDGGRDRKALRAQVGLPDLPAPVPGLEDTSLTLSYEVVRTDLTGTGFEYLIVDDSVKPYLREFDPDTDFTPHNGVNSINHPVAASIDFDTFVGNLETSLLGWRVYGIGGFAKLQSATSTDVDFGPAPMTWTDPNAEDSDQATVELRTSSPRLSGFLGLDGLFGYALGQSDVTTGFFYQHRRLDNHVSITLNAPVAAGFIAFQRMPESGIPPIGPETTTAVFGQDVGIEQVTNDFLQISDAFAGFAQTNWHLTDRVTLVAGLRYTQESKEADFLKEFTEGSGIAFNALASQEEFQATRSRSESAFTPKVSAMYAWNDDLSLYGGWARGFKAGGFNAQVSNPNKEDAFDFEKEIASSWEVGLKGTFLAGTAQLNLGLYNHTITDQQVFTQLPDTLETIVENAGESRSRGVEADGSWLATDWLTLVSTFAFTDSEFLEFPFGGCSGDRSNTDGDDDERCDLTGQPFLRTPKWQSTLTANTRFGLDTLPGLSALSGLTSGGTDLVFGLTGEYWDTHFTADTFDPRLRQGSFFRFSGNTGFEAADGTWSLRVTGENLTNEEIAITSRDIPLAAGNFIHVPEPKRLFFGTFRWRF